MPAQNVGACSKYRRLSKINAHVQNICAYPKYMRTKIYAHVQNICAYPKYMRMSKIYAHIQNIYACPKYMRISKIYASIRKIGAQTLTIWARQNLQLLTSSKSGWRALVQVMLSLLHAVLKWSEHPGRPAYMGSISPVLYRLLYRHDLSKYLRPVQISAGAYIFTIFWEKVKNLSRLLSVL